MPGILPNRPSLYMKMTTPQDPIRSRIRRASIAGTVSLVVIAVAVGLAFLPPDDSETNTERPLQEFEYSFTAYESSADLLADYQGRPLVINFFASWCAPCRAELPDFVDAHAEFGDRVGFVGIDYLDPVRQEAVDLLSSIGVSYDIALDENGALLDELSGLPAMPTTIFIDIDGSVAKKHRGVILEDELRAEIEGLL